jgi:hypothetical protein
MEVRWNGKPGTDIIHSTVLHMGHAEKRKPLSLAIWRWLQEPTVPPWILPSFSFGSQQPNNPSIRKQKKQPKNIAFPFTDICPHALSWSSGIKTDSLFDTCSQILIPWLGDIVDNVIGLLYRPASLSGRMGRYNNPMPKSP